MTATCRTCRTCCHHLVDVDVALTRRDRLCAERNASPDVLLHFAAGPEAVACARLRPGKQTGRIPIGFLPGVLRDEVLNPRKPDPPWWLDERTAVAKGREVGVTASPGESAAAFHARIREAMHRRRRHQPEAA